jgi:recombination protein RecT
MNSKAPAKRDVKQQENPLQVFKDLLDRQTPAFQATLPAQVVDRFKVIIMTTLVDKPDLMRCKPQSLINVCRHAAQDGLMLDGREAAIVPFKIGGELIATYMPMVIGLRKKVRASELVADWNCQVVFEDDPVFDIGFGDRPYVHHKPALSGGGKRKIVGVYSVATFKDGTKSIEWMTFDQIEEARKASAAVKAGKPTPWDNWYSEMARKTVTRRHAKSLPMASDIEMIFRREEQSQDDGGAAGTLPPPQQMALPSTDYSVAHTLDEFASGSLPADDTPHTTSNVADERGGGAQIRDQSPPADVHQSAPADNRGNDPPSDYGAGKDWGAEKHSPNMENVDQHQRQPRQPSDMPTQQHVDEAVNRGKLAAEISTAWQRGRNAAKDGGPRKAIPGEYRDNPKLWNAWLDGFDNVGGEKPA